jgi:hypothetical protein
MKAITAFLATMVLAGPALTIRAGAEAPVALTVRLYNTSGIPAPELVAARGAADAILGDVGLDVVFRHCGRPVSPDDPIDRCNEPLKPSEVVVRVINAPAFNATLHPDAYGVTYVVRETNRGWLATVFSDRIGQAAERVGVEPGTLLGLVMAHEIGHLLLGTGYHGEAGLMRAEWPDALLARAADWKFSVVEAARMHRVLESGPIHF